MAERPFSFGECVVSAWLTSKSLIELDCGLFRNGGYGLEERIVGGEVRLASTIRGNAKATDVAIVEPLPVVFDLTFLAKLWP